MQQFLVVSPLTLCDSLEGDPFKAIAIARSTPLTISFEAVYKQQTSVRHWTANMSSIADNLQDYDPFLDTIKWSLLVVNGISTLYIAVIFFQYLFSRPRPEGLCAPFVFNCIIGFITTIVGSYAALQEEYSLLICFAIFLLVNMVVATFAGEFVFKLNLGLYSVSVILAVLEAYLVHRSAHHRIVLNHL